jgi:hypothetical protein
MTRILGIHDAGRMRRLQRTNLRIMVLAAIGTLFVLAVASWLLFVSAAH